MRRIAPLAGLATAADRNLHYLYPPGKRGQDFGKANV
jgi:hypothetical protein